MNILIMGPAGCGKGTMSDKIVVDFPVLHVSTGDMLRNAIKSKSKIGLEAKSYMDAGKLVPDSVILQMVEELLVKDKNKNGFLFDGFPRTLVQAEAFDEMLTKINSKVDVVLNLEVDFDVLANRITGRRLCKNCGAIYHKTNHPPKIDNVCDNCGSELYQRSDDTIEQLTVRLNEHKNLTQPVLDYYCKQNIVRNINASESVEVVYSNIKKVLEN